MPRPNSLATDTAGVYAAEFTVPAGSWEYKVAVNDSWDEAYGLNGGGDNIPLTVGGRHRGARRVRRHAQAASASRPTGLRGAYDAASDAALVADPVRQPGSDEVFYFVMTDRFANGDTANDDGRPDRRPPSHGLRPDRQGLLPRRRPRRPARRSSTTSTGLGTTAIWLTPSFKNRPVQGEGANASAGYHGYWITDFTQIDPHLGTNAELEALIAEAHARGIKVYFDIITNHTADVIDYEEGQYSYVDKATAPYRDAAGDAVRPGRRTPGDAAPFPALDAATSFPYTPVLTPEDADRQGAGVAQRPDAATTTAATRPSRASRSTYGDFVGLDDLFTEHPDGRRRLRRRLPGLGRLRHRRLPHRHRQARQLRVLAAVRRQRARPRRTRVGNDDFFMFGEVYDADPAKLSPYVRDDRHERGARLRLPVAGA